VIAAVIILIVFLAVPALQRNSRNNQRKNDVSRISAAITETSNNNNGTLPVAFADISGNVGNLGFYTAANVSYSTTANSNTDENTVIIRNGRTCSTSGSGADNVTTASGSGRQFVILYSVETGGDGDDQCLQG
jgi:type IV pilus assembly protein PilA